MLVRNLKYLLVITAIGLLALAAACNTATQPASNSQSNNSGTQTNTKSESITVVALDPSAEYQAEIKAEPAEIKAGEQTTLTFTVKNKQGALVKDLQVVHEKLMHLLIVSQDLSEFDHQHPEQQSDGSFKLNYKFTSGGKYLLYSDFTPQGEEQTVDRFDVTVSGTARQNVPLTEDKEMTKTVDGLSVTMMPDKLLKAGEELLFNFVVKDAQTKQPVTDLQKYLGALAHFVIISEDTTKYLHVHPMEGGEKMKDGDMKDGMPGMKHDAMPVSKEGMKGDKPTVSAHTTFPKTGLYKLWAQFQRGGKVIVVPFVVRVAAGEKITNNGKDTAPSDALKVTVSKSGFEPASLTVKKGQTVKIAFYRKDSENCASEIVFPSLNVKKKLPVGQTVVVEIKPEKMGDLNFACGMGMMKGKLIVSE